MINIVEITNHLGESIELDMRFPEKSGFLIQGIDGLGPTRANINLTELATDDGSLFNSARSTARNLVFHLKFISSSSDIEVIRNRAYKYFPIKEPVIVTIKTDTLECYTTGYVESNEPNIFSKEEGTTISILCPDPYFYNEKNDLYVFSSIVYNFSFPFSNNSLVTPLLVMGDIDLSTTKVVPYNGDIPIGVVIKIHAMGTVKNITIFNTKTREIMLIDTDRLETMIGTPIIVGDDIIVNTIKRQKSITLYRNGLAVNILNCVDKNAHWFQLIPGNNLFGYTAEVGLTNLQFQLENPIAYSGV